MPSEELARRLPRLRPLIHCERRARGHAAPEPSASPHPPEHSS
jgi:hypothetical protein